MKARITFYKINRCGFYYPRSKYNNTPLFLGIKDLLNQLSQWGIGKELYDTDIFKNTNNNGFCTYLADIQSNINSTILVIWNQVPSTDAGVLSLPNNSKVGKILKADANSIKSNSIPGYPTYFWFIPDQNIFATICFDTIVNGRKNMEDYLKQFMMNFSDNVVKEYEEGTKNIKGYSKNPADKNEAIYKYPPTFSSCRYSKIQELDIIKQKAPEITKITKKATADYKNEVGKSLYQKVVGVLNNIKRDPIESDKFTVKTELSLSNGLTSEEVSLLYEDWEEELTSLHSLDYGFKIGTEQFWFSHSLAKWEGNLSLSFTEQNSFGNISKLLNELEKQKNR